MSSPTGTFASIAAHVQTALKEGGFYTHDPDLVALVPEDKKRMDVCAECGDLPPQSCPHCGGGESVPIGDAWEAAESLPCVEKVDRLADVEEALLRRATARYTGTVEREVARVGHLHARLARARAAVALAIATDGDVGGWQVEEARALRAFAYA